MWTRAAASKPVGLPGDVRGGIFDGTEQSEDPAFGGGMRRSFEHMLDLNRPMQPCLSDLPWGFAGDNAPALAAEVGHWGVTDG